MKSIKIKTDDAETNLGVGVWAVCRQVCLVAGSVAVVIGIGGSSGGWVASEEGRVMERADTPRSALYAAPSSGLLLAGCCRFCCL